MAWSKPLDNTGRYSTNRERSFGAVATVPDQQATLLRPDAFLVDRTTRTVTAIGFTFPNDANLGHKCAINGTSTNSGLPTPHAQTR